MGIPHLISTLGPYSQQKALQDVDLVVDGPALAHHILHVCRANGVDHPSPRLLGNCVVSWLDKLASQNAVTTAIYFDGYLPATKRPVRMERTVKSTLRLKVFHENHHRGCPRNLLCEGRSVAPIDAFKKGSLECRPLKAPSFLVPSVIQALQRSKAYGHLVHIVPGEADGYCAKAVADNGGVVITSDSDLLVHELGSGSVALLRGIHLDDDATVRATLYCPRQIFGRLGLTSRLDIYRFAYERWLSAPATTPMLLRACTKSVADEPGFQSFCRQYQEEERAVVPCINYDAPLSLAGLDPRLAEFVLQLSQPPVSDASNKAFSMFLPVLIDSPDMGTAWENSRYLRELAYSIICRTFGTLGANVQEYRRLQSIDHKGRQVNIPTPSLANATAEYITTTLSNLKSFLNGPKKTLYWTLVYMILDIQGSTLDNRSSLTLDILGGKHPRDNVNFVPWTVVHWIAQMQAVYYSLRMLRQVIEISTKSSQVVKLGTSLSRLPSLTDSPDFHSICMQLGLAKRGEIEKLLSHFVELPKPPREKRRSKRSFEEKNNAVKSTYRTDPVIQNNIFELLPHE